MSDSAGRHKEMSQDLLIDTIPAPGRDARLKTSTTRPSRITFPDARAIPRPRDTDKVG
ncbi:hypothetical protein [Embleya sp. NBC_00896]|uniref:hypothetical protein n=1 Tax=Embleya sp. NBC_00896 TaxID=2975961 RepID=UPI003870E781|nr:hypothetical protein OG928_31890 [Embleya sp. NBC_00896]